MAAAIVAVVVIGGSSFIKTQPGVTNELTQEPSNPLQDTSVPDSMKDYGQTYKINTQCELLFGMIAAQYPDGTPLPKIEINALLEKYPEEFKEWKATLEDPEKAKAFSQNVPEGFNQVLIPIMMKESSINPDLISTAMLLVDPERNTKLKQIYDENSCKEFFDSHQPASPAP